MSLRLTDSLKMAVKSSYTITDDNIINNAQCSDIVPNLLCCDAEIPLRFANTQVLAGQSRRLTLSVKPMLYDYDAQCLCCMLSEPSKSVQFTGNNIPTV